MNAGTAQGSTVTTKNRGAEGEPAPCHLQRGGTGLALQQAIQGAAAPFTAPLIAVMTLQRPRKPPINNAAAASMPCHGWK